MSKIANRSLSLIVLFLFLTVFGMAAESGTSAQPSHTELVDRVHVILGDTAQQTRMEQVLVDGHLLLLIGERAHTDPKYRELSSSLQQMAIERQLVLFKEALPRHPDIESTWSQVLFKSKDNGSLFGIENDLAYLIADWVIDVSRFRFSGGQREKSQNENFLYKFILSSKAMPIWEVFVQYATKAPLNQMATQLTPQIRAFVDAVNAGETPLPLQEEFTPAEWATLHLALLQVAAREPDLPEEQHLELEALIKDPMNPNTLVAFNDSFGRRYRSQRMAQNLLETLPTVPKGSPVVVLIGEGHLDDVLQDLSTHVQ